MLAEPSPTWLTRPYWDAAAKHKLIRPQCSSCGASFFSPQIACPKCTSEQWTWEPSSGRGVIYSASTVHKPPHPGIAVPYVFAVVVMDEGWNILSNIVHCRPEDVKPGMRVKVNWERRIGGYTIPCFEPDAGAGGAG
jgi:uncharacterized OB-fold protein